MAFAFEKLLVYQKSTACLRGTNVKGWSRSGRRRVYSIPCMPPDRM